jgi:hypothetical protein
VRQGTNTEVVVGQGAIPALAVLVRLPQVLLALRVAMGQVVAVEVAQTPLMAEAVGSAC